MKRYQKSHVVLLIALGFISGCNKLPEEITAAPRFDATVVAAEADKGNIGPLTDLNNACSAEVEKNGKRLAVCKVQDDVRDLRKPLNIRF